MVLAPPATDSTGVLSAGPAHRRRARRPFAAVGAVAVFGALAGAGLYLVARDAMPDDAYTTFAYARTLAEHGVWGAYPDVPANTATSPLNVMLLAAITLVTGTAVGASGVLLAGTFAALAVVLHRLGGPVAAVGGIGLLVGCPITNSAVGMEIYVGLALMLALLDQALHGRSWWPAGILAGLLALTRADLAPVAVIILLVAAPRRAAPALVLGAAVAIPFHAWTWVARGSFLPDTMAVKAVLTRDWQRFPADYEYYSGAFPAAVAVAEATVLVGLVALVVAITRADRAGAAIGLAAVGNAAAFTVAGAGPTFYYYSTLVAGLGLCTVLVVADLTRGWQPQRVAAGARGALLIVPAVLVIAAGLVVSFNRDVPWSDGFAPIRFNWATTAQYRAVAQGLPPGVVETTSGADVGGGAEIGVLAYFAPPGTRVVEFLTDPGRTAQYISQWRAEHGGVVADLNYRHYRLPTPLRADWFLVYSASVPPGATPITTVDVPQSIRLQRDPPT